MNRSNEIERPQAIPASDMRNDPAPQSNLAAGVVQGHYVFNEQPINQRMAELSGRDTSPTPAPGQLGYKVSKIEDISIQQLDRGFIVRVGCQTMAISNVHELVNKLTAYLMQPDRIREQYFLGNF